MDVVKLLLMWGMILVVVVLGIKAVVAILPYILGIVVCLAIGGFLVRWLNGRDTGKQPSE